MIQIKEKLFDLSDDKYREFNQKLCPDTKRKMIGIRVPEIKKMAKELLKQYEVKELLASLTDEYFEEVLLQAVIIGYSKLDLEEKLNLITEFVPKIDSWAISDTFVPSLKINKKDLEKVWNFILPYTKSDKQFYVRFAVIMMLDYFITEEYVDKVIEQLDKINNDGYYVKMGVAWTIAEIAIKFYDKAVPYLKNNNLDKFTHNKAIQKMIESRRISDKQKEYLRKQKRK